MSRDAQRYPQTNNSPLYKSPCIKYHEAETVMDIARIREMFQQGHFSFYLHALQEALKDGITGNDVLHTVEHGEIIEEYPERKRCLIFAATHSGTPLHVVVDYSCEDELQIVTTYVPDRREWIGYRKRRG